MNQLRLIVGNRIILHVGEQVQIFQDTEAIPFGSNWSAKIKQTIDDVTFFIPVVTPAFLRSVACRDEFRAFRRRMTALGRDDLIFPIHYADVDWFSPVDIAFEDDFDELRRSQWIDFRSFYYDELDSSKIRQWADRLAASILGALRRTVQTQQAPPSHDEATSPGVTSGSPEAEEKSPSRRGSSLANLELAPIQTRSVEAEVDPNTLLRKETARSVTKEQHLDPGRHPKRILSLDGGGIRGVLTLEYLESIESLLRQRYGEPELVLADYFDLVGGTSTGSIIAAGLACGMRVRDIKELYYGIGASVFQQSSLMLPGVVAPKFPSEPLQMALDRALGADTTLDSNRLRTGLMVMTKRIDTGSPWPLHNSGRGQYANQDGALRLTQIVRASTAAPTYFDPERITISSRDGTAVDGEFVDGGVSPFNDPALQLLMLAALEGHGLRWRTGKEQLLLISVGTGTYRMASHPSGLIEQTAAAQGLRALTSLMDDCARTNQAMLQWLTDCLTPWQIDRALGDMRLDSRSGPQLATYVRYNVLLEPAWLSSTLKVEFTGDRLAQLRKMDNPANMIAVAELGRDAAKVQVKSEHFPPAFDLA
jgi:uncharacterized protein